MFKNNLTDKWKLSEGDEDDINIDDKEKLPVTNQFLTPPFHRDSPSRLSMQLLGESSGFVFFMFFFSY